MIAGGGVDWHTRQSPFQFFSEIERGRKLDPLWRQSSANITLAINFGKKLKRSGPYTALTPPSHNNYHNNYHNNHQHA